MNPLSGVICNNTRKLRDGEQSLLPMSMSLANLVHKHILSMKEKGYFEEISQMDFFHGHLIHKTFKDRVSRDKFGKEVSAILYHTAESNKRWSIESSEKPDHEQRTQRSLIGWPDGSVDPAIQWIDLNDLKVGRKRIYHLAGTIYTSDIAEQNPDLSVLDYSRHSERRVRKILIEFKNGLFELYVSEFFLVLQKSDGRFQLADGTPYEIYLDIRNIKRRIGYADSPECWTIINEGVSLYPYLN